MYERFKLFNTLLLSSSILLALFLLQDMVWALFNNGINIGSNLIESIIVLGINIFLLCASIYVAVIIGNNLRNKGGQSEETHICLIIMIVSGIITPILLYAGLLYIISMCLLCVSIIFFLKN